MYILVSVEGEYISPNYVHMYILVSVEGEYISPNTHYWKSSY